MKKTQWYFIHGWVGLKLSLLLSFVLITGTLAVIAHELDWLSNKAIRVDSQTVSTMNWLEIYRQTQRYIPKQELLHIKAPLDPWFAAEVVFFHPNQQLQRLFFHPSTGKFQGEGRWQNWQRSLRMLHRHLMLPIVVGVIIVGLLAILLFISLISSLYIYPQWWRGFFRFPRWRHPKIFWRDLHRLLGVWSSLFIVIISITGIWYLLEIIGFNATYPIAAKAITIEQTEIITRPTEQQFAEMLAKVQQHYPELLLEEIQFPQAGGVITFIGQAEAVLVRPRANKVSFDPGSGALLQIDKGIELSWYARISEAADPLHFGTFFGLSSKIIYFIFGIILSTLTVIGLYQYKLKVARKLESTWIHWQKVLKNMGQWKWLNILLINIACLILVITLVTG